MSHNVIEFPDHLGARSTDPVTSDQSAEQSGKVRGKIADAVEELAEQAGERGIIINEATAALPQFKPVSISPVFRPLVRTGKLFQVVLGYTKPSPKRASKPIYATRFDSTTNRNCNLYFHHSVRGKKGSGAVSSFDPPPARGFGGLKAQTVCL